MLSPAERDALVTKHRSYAERLARNIKKTLSPAAPGDELIATAIEGLVLASQRFDPDKGATFTTFAYYRIRGAVFDYVRKYARNDPHSRARASGDAAVDDLAERALATLAAGTTPGDTAALAAEALGAVLEQAAVAFTVTECAQALAGDYDTHAPDEVAARREEATMLRQAIESLDDKYRTLMTAVYFQGTTIEEAGRSLGLSKSWASRMHARGLALLREYLEAHPSAG